MDKLTLLKSCFGHSEFRSGQERLIDAILSGRDVFGVMPTGGGKSICYQLPALMLDGVSIVISPLISLMKDQVAALRENGVGAELINSSLSADELREAYARIRAGRCPLVYVAPERLESDGFAAIVRTLRVGMVAVDEAHCVSQWGQDFRPSYLKIARFIASLPRRPVVAAFTATATNQVREDVINKLELREPVCLVTGFDRPNLFYEVRTPADKSAELMKLLKERSGKSGIVYCATRATVDKVWAALWLHGFTAARYHAGMSEDERKSEQEAFQYDRRRIMVATNAFGMGIDKSNVGFVIHYNMPKSIEAYYQEAGRAGRDGEDADCILLYSAGDIASARRLIESSNVSDAERREYLRRETNRLNRMADYCRTSSCLRHFILGYFGQESPERCGRCSNCLTPLESVDVTVKAQMVLSCVKRIHDALGYSVGASLLTEVLRGQKSARLISLNLDRLTTYGLMRVERRGDVYALIDALREQELLVTDPRHGGISLGKDAGEVLFRGKSVAMNVRKTPQRSAAEAKEPANAAESALRDALYNLRTEIARRQNVPAYVVFPNKTLDEMAKARPKTVEEFLALSGVGETKARRYGEAFLKEISAQSGENNG